MWATAFDEAAAKLPSLPGSVQGKVKLWRSAAEEIQTSTAVSAAVEALPPPPVPTLPSLAPVELPRYLQPKQKRFEQGDGGDDSIEPRLDGSETDEALPSTYSQSTTKL